MLCSDFSPAVVLLSGPINNPNRRTRACSHPQQFTYRRSSQLPCPSLRRGWILQPNKDKPNSAFEVLLPGSEEEYASATGAEVVLEDDQVRTNGFRKDHGPEPSNREDGKQLLRTKPKYVRGPNIDKKSFLRVYYISALRIPKGESWELAHELREHLLNWPRVNNIASFPSNDVDEDLANLFYETRETKVSDPVNSLRRAVYALEKKDEEVNSETETSVEEVTRSTQKSSLPKKATRKSVEKNSSSVRAAQSSVQKNAPTTLELVPEEGENGSSQRCWLQSEKKWPGPSRLLMLDERLAGKTFGATHGFAVQAVHSRFSEYAPSNESGLVTCRLTLFYEYWSLDEVLQELLPVEALAPVAFERTGHVAELKLHPEQLPFQALIAQVFLDKYKPHVRSVVVKNEVVRRRNYSVEVELLAGRSSLVTTVWEHGNPFRIDMASVVWDSRLSTDRQCLIGMFSEDDVVCDVFAGVGLVAVPAGKKVRRVFANDANPWAHFYLAKNVVERGVASRVEIFNQDTHKFLNNVFHMERPLAVTQVVMSHPSASVDLLGDFHPEEDFCKQIAAVMGTDPSHIHATRVVELAPKKWMFRASFVLPSDVGFGYQLQRKRLSSRYGR